MGRKIKDEKLEFVVLREESKQKRRMYINRRYITQKITFRLRHQLSKSESVKFSLIESVICLFTV